MYMSVYIHFVIKKKWKNGKAIYIYFLCNNYKRNNLYIYVVIYTNRHIFIKYSATPTIYSCYIGVSELKHRIKSGIYI